MKRTSALRAAILTVSTGAFLLVAGCGGDNDDPSGLSSTPPASKTKAEFVDAANAICAEKGSAMQKKTLQILKGAQGTSNRAQLQAIDTAIVPNLEAEVDELRALTPPVGHEARVERILSAIEDTVDQLRNAKPVDADSTFEENHPYRPGEQIAARYGLTACGHP